jgi:flagellar basal-body rod modification protein FlgD
MVAQMAQFSSLAGVTETNTTLQKISEQLTAQTALLQEIKASTLAPASPETQSTQEG